MRNRTMTTNIGTIDLSDIALMEDSLEVFIPIVAVSENLKATIEENTQIAKAEYQKEFLDGKGKKWSDAGISMEFQSLHITMMENKVDYELCFGFEDMENTFETGFNIAVDLSEHTEELKQLILNKLIGKFFD